MEIHHTTNGAGYGTLVAPDSMTNPDSYFQNYTGGMYSVAFKGIYSVSSNLLLNASIARVTRHDTGEPATEVGNDAFYNDEITNIWSGGTGGWWDSYPLQHDDKYFWNIFL